MRLAAPSFLAVTLVAGVASAHAVLTTPTPRSPRDDIKTDAPCGNIPRGAQPALTYTEGQQNVAIQFKETIDHSGCFVATLLRTGDTVATPLGTLVDNADTIPTGGRAASMTFNLPAGVTCNRCTIQLRQVMSGTPTCDAGTFNASTYFSCADIRITYLDSGVPPDDTPATDGGTTTGGDDAGTGNTGGTPGTGTGTGGGTGAGNGSGGGKKDASAAAPAADDEEGPNFKAKDAGCALHGGAAGAAGAAGWLVVALGAFVARRRRNRAG